jgi:RNA recognition motif-containing protein
MKLHIANLPREFDEGKIRELFKPFGTVAEVKVVPDKVTGKPSGFAFIDMPEEADGKAAIGALHGREMEGLKLSLIEVEPVEDSSGRRKGTVGWKPRGGKAGGGPKGGGYRGGHPQQSGAVRRA